MHLSVRACKREPVRPHVFRHICRASPHSGSLEACALCAQGPEAGVAAEKQRSRGWKRQAWAGAGANPGRGEAARLRVGGQGGCGLPVARAGDGGADVPCQEEMQDRSLQVCHFFS